MTKDDLAEIQVYLQMYDKGIISKKTVLEKIGVDAEEEEKQIKKEYDELQKKYQTPNMSGVLGGGAMIAGTDPSVGSIVESNVEPY